MARAFDLPTARAFGVVGPGPHLGHARPTTVIDRVLGVTAADGSELVATSSRRLPGDIGARAVSAIDGDPTTHWSPAYLDQGTDAPPLPARGPGLVRPPRPPDRSPTAATPCPPASASRPTVRPRRPSTCPAVPDLEAKDAIGGRAARLPHRHRPRPAVRGRRRPHREDRRLGLEEPGRRPRRHRRARGPGAPGRRPDRRLRQRVPRRSRDRRRRPGDRCGSAATWPTPSPAPGCASRCAVGAWSCRRATTPSAPRSAATRASTSTAWCSARAAADGRQVPVVSDRRGGSGRPSGPGGPEVTIEEQGRTSATVEVAAA